MVKLSYSMKEAWYVVLAGVCVLSTALAIHINTYLGACSGYEGCTKAYIVAGLGWTILATIALMYKKRKLKVVNLTKGDKDE